MAWYTDNPELYEHDMKFVRRNFPDIVTEEIDNRIVLHGAFPVVDNNGQTLRTYDLRVVFPDNYPQWVPDVFMREPNVKWIADRHMYEDGQACLCLPFEIPMKLRNGICFEEFYEKLLRFWLIGQAGYDASGKWPFPARSHGREGEAEAIADALGIKDIGLARRFAATIFSTAAPTPDSLCPCGFGRKVSECHGSIIEYWRGRILEYHRLIGRKKINK